MARAAGRGGGVGNPPLIPARFGVVPAKAWTQLLKEKGWMPAIAGMTFRGLT